MKYDDEETDNKSNEDEDVHSDDYGNDLEATEES